MHGLIRRLLSAAAGAILIVLPACSGDEVQGELQPFEHLIGHWNAEHVVFGAETVYAATYDIKFEGGDTLIHDFHSEFGGGFQGHEELRFDAEKGKLVAEWTDSDSDEVGHTEGSYDAATRTLTMTGKGPGFEDPNVLVGYRHVTVYGDGVADYTMFLIPPEGEEREVMSIHMTQDS